MSNQKRRIVKPPKQTTPQTAADALPTEEAQRRRKHHIRPKLLQMLRNADGQPVTVDEFCVAFGASKSTVQYGMNKLAESIPQVEVVQKANIWRWDASSTEPRATEPEEQEPEEVWYIQVGMNAEGEPLIRKDGEGAMGQLFRAVPL